MCSARLHQYRLSRTASVGYTADPKFLAAFLAAEHFDPDMDPIHLFMLMLVPRASHFLTLGDAKAEFAAGGPVVMTD